MSPLNFTEEDKKKVIEFLNTVSKHATFKVSTNELIGYFQLLAFMQQQILPKIEANILEVKRVIEAPIVAQPETKTE